MAAMGLVVMVTVSSASLSPDRDLCCQEGKKRFMITRIHTTADKHTLKGIFIRMSVELKAHMHTNTHTKKHKYSTVK